MVVGLKLFGRAGEIYLTNKKWKEIDRMSNGEDEIERMVTLYEQSEERGICSSLAKRSALYTPGELLFKASFEQNEKEETLMGCALKVNYEILDIQEVVNMNIILVEAVPSSIPKPENYRIFGKNDQLGEIVAKLRPGQTAEFINKEGEHCKLTLEGIELGSNDVKEKFFKNF